MTTKQTSLTDQELSAYLERLASGRDRGLEPAFSMREAIRPGRFDRSTKLQPTADLVARPCAMHPVAWHLDALERGICPARSECRDVGREDVDVARVRYHARWLGRHLFPEDACHRPLVSVVIPVHNGAATITRSIRSCLRQTYDRIEVVVVDDGSTDELRESLAPFCGEIVVVHKENGGVSSARNVGVASASGELVHFLDADDYLDADCIERKIDAMAAVADAEICVSLYRSVGSNGFKHAETHVPPAVTGVDSPTIDLLTTVARRYAVHTSTVLAARWALLENGPFEEDLKQSEDTRFWFKLGLRGTKVIALNAELNTRCFVPGSLTSQPAEHRRYWGIAFFRTLLDLVERPRHWPYVGCHIRRGRNPVCWNAINNIESDELIRLRGRLLKIAAGLNVRGADHGISARPVMAVLKHFFRAAHDRHGAKASVVEPFYPRIAEALRKGMERSADPTEADLDFWLSHHVTRTFPRHNRPALRSLYEWAHNAGSPVVSLARLRRLHETWPRHPWRHRWRFLFFVSRHLGPARATTVSRFLEKATVSSRGALLCISRPARRCVRPVGIRARRWLWQLEQRIWEAETRRGIGWLVSLLKYVKKRSDQGHVVRPGRREDRT